MPKIWFFFVSAAFCFILMDCRRTTLPEDPRAILEQARELKAGRQFDQAEQLLDPLIKRNPDHYDIVLEMADILFAAHRYEEAEIRFQKALELHPENIKITAQIWECRYEASGKNPHEIDSIRQEITALSQKGLPGLEVAYSGAVIIQDMELFEKISLKIATGHPESKLTEEIMQMHLNAINTERDNTRRLELCNDFMANFPNSKHISAVISGELYAYSAMDGKAKVIERAEYWISRYPNDMLVHHIVAMNYLRLDIEPERAIPVIRKAIDLFLKDPKAASFGHFQFDRRHMEAVLRFLLARALLGSGEAAEAIQELEKLKPEPGQEAKEYLAQYHYLRGRTLSESGKPDLAFDEFSQAAVAGAARNAWVKESLDEISQFCKAHDIPDCMDEIRRRQKYAGPTFDDVTEIMGLGAVKAGRVAWTDVNADGYDDLILDGSFLFINSHGKSFRNETSESGLLPGRQGAVLADIDNDGDADMFALSHAEDRTDSDVLYLNDGSGGFTATLGSAVADPFPTEGAAFGDFNGDGHVDLYVANYEQKVTEAQPERGIGTPDLLYLNMGGGTFIDATMEGGIIPPFGIDLCGRGVSCCDFDNDRDQDIYVSNYRLQENFLWRNDGGQFVDVAVNYDVAGIEKDGYWGHTIGSDWGDADNDGWMDLFSANLAHPNLLAISDISYLYLNKGPEYKFINATSESNITYDETHSDPTWLDADNDGDLDLYITSIYEAERSYLYLNDGAAHFEDVTFLSGTRAYNGWGCGFSDFDNDGDLDIVVGSSSGVKVFRNRGSGNHWMGVRFRGAAVPGSGIGARVKTTRNGKTQIREIQAGKGTTSQNAPCAYFGFGDSQAPADLQITLPNGMWIEKTNVPVDQIVVIEVLEKR